MVLRTKQVLTFSMMLYALMCNLIDGAQPYGMLLHRHRDLWLIKIMALSSHGRRVTYR